MRALGATERPKETAYWIGVGSHLDDRGYLGYVQNPELPFECRRAYWLTGVPAGASRGGHGHYDLEQVLIALSGEVTVSVGWEDDLQDFSLIATGPALYIPAGRWRKLSNFESGTIVLVLASALYDPDDYFDSEWTVA